MEQVKPARLEKMKETTKPSKNGSTRPANDPAKTITIVVNSDHYQVEIEIY